LKANLKSYYHYNEKEKYVLSTISAGGIHLFLIALLMFYKEYTFNASSVVTMGTVKELSSSVSLANQNSAKQLDEMSQSVEIVFTTIDGQNASVFLAMTDDMSFGEEVEIHYLKSAPSKAKSNRFLQNWIKTFLSSLIFLFFCIVFYFLSKTPQFV
jgi:hypothetical protein